MKEIVLGLAVVIGVLAAAVAIGSAINYRVCHNQWRDSKAVLEVDWGFLQGCKIKTEKDGWIPAANFRVW